MRRLYTLSILLLLCWGISAQNSYDLVIVGGNPGGIMAAIAAAREGKTSVILERTTHVGGLPVNGLGATDIATRQATTGLFSEFTSRVKQYYIDRYGDKSQQVKDCSDGFHFEPLVAAYVYKQMLEEHKDKINVLLMRQFDAEDENISLRDGHIESIRILNRETGQNETYSGKIFIDATYEGDLGAAAGVPFHVGATVMYWNADLLESYGLDYKSVKTWDDYTKLGEELKEASNGEVYLTSVDTGGVDWMWLAMAENGEDWTGGPDGTVNVQLDSVKEMLTMQQNWLNDGIAMVSTDGHVDLEAGFSNIMDGKIASFPKAMWYMSRFKDYMPEMEGKYDITTCPVFEEGQKCSVGIGGTGTVVTNQCENPELAAEWLAWAKCSEEGENLIWNELGFDVCNTALWSDEAFAYDESNTYNTFFRVKPYEVLNELAENDAIGTVYTTKNSPTLNDYMCTTTLNNVLEDGMDVDEALQDAQDYLDFECE